MANDYDINLSDGTILTTLRALESDGPNNFSTPRLIVETSDIANTFRLSTDLTTRFIPGFHFTVSASASGVNDGVYKVASSVFAAGPNETIIVIDTGPIIAPMTKNNITSIALPLGQINYSIGAASALLLPGKGTMNYGEQMVENIVHLLENFASSEGIIGEPALTSPAGIGSPLFGQQWWNNTQEVMFRFTQTNGWTSDLHLGTGSLFFQDTENPFNSTAEIELTGSGDDVGMSITNLLNPNPLDSILQIRSSDFTIRFEVDHEGFFGGHDALAVAGSVGNQDSWIDTNVTINRGFPDTLGGVVGTPYTAAAGISLDVGSGNVQIDNNQGFVSVAGARLSTDATGLTFAARPANAVGNRFTIQDNTGVNKLFVDPNGNVGVNKVPAATLDVEGSSVQDYFRVNNNLSSLLFLIAADNSVESVNTFYVDRTNSTFVVNTITDFVGINQATPASALDVTGDGHFTGHMGINNVVPSGTVFLEVTGDVVVNSQIRGSDQTAAGPTYSWINSPTMGLYRVADNQIGFATNSSERFRITDTDIQLHTHLDTNGQGIDNNLGTGLNITGGSLNSAVNGASSVFRGVDNISTGDGGGITIAAGSSTGGDGGALVLALGNNKPIDLLPGAAGDNVLLRFREHVGLDYIGLIAPTAGGLTTTREWTLPIDDPALSVGKALVTSALGVLSFNFLTKSADTDGDTQLQLEKVADDDTIRFDVGDSPSGYGVVTDIFTIASSGWTVSMGTANVATTIGAPINLTAGTGNTTGSGGTINISGGTGGISIGGDGGDVTINGGSAGIASAGNGGDVRLIGGAGDGAGVGGIINTLSPHVSSAGTVIPPTAFLEIVPGSKVALTLGIGLAGLPPGTMTVVVDDATPPTPFVLAIVDGTGTWVRTDTYAAIT